jgi:hypothetical protein
MTKQTLKEKLEGGKFKNFSGELYFTYEQPYRDIGISLLSEIIPQEIIDKGEQAIIKYVMRKLRKAKKGWKEFEDAEDAIKENPIPIQTEYKGIVLKGRIIEATILGVGTELDEPLKGFGWAPNPRTREMDTFTDDNKLSKYAYNAAYECLCDAYEEALLKPKNNLAERLNKK